MATRMMKKVSSSLLPLANRRTPSYGNYTSAIRTTQLKSSTSSVRSIGTSSNTNLSSHLSRATSGSTHRPTSAPANKESNSDATLLKNIQAEIDEFLMVPEAPREFPFKIEDDEYERKYIILTREYQDEQIKVTVSAADYSRSVDLIVSVTKKGGSTLEFDVKADETDELTIESWALKNPSAPDDDGPEFTDLDGCLQDNFYTYLGDRGIKPSFTTFLCDYMDYKEADDSNEEENEQILWLMKLKNFLEK